MSRCKHIGSDGGAHRSPEQFIGVEGYCQAHGPTASATMVERGRKGAEATHRRSKSQGLDADDLPPLKTQDAKDWLETIGRSVAIGRLGDRPAPAAITACRGLAESRSRPRDCLCRERLVESSGASRASLLRRGVSTWTDTN